MELKTSDALSRLRISTCEMHTGGEALRIIEDGFPHVSGQTILQKIAFIRENYDYIRKFLMFEPRGHYDMYGTLQVEPDIPEADVAFIFMHNEGYSTMCGHAVISLGRYCVDKGLVQAKEPETLVKIQCPCGLVPAYVTCKNGVTSSVRFHSVPCFVFASDIQIHVPNIGNVNVDIAYGGAFYSLVPLQALGVKFEKGKMNHIVKVGHEATEAAKQVIKPEHPESSDLSFLYGTIIYDLSQLEKTDTLRMITVFADSELDRSPCGSGTCAVVSMLHKKGLIGVGKEIFVESGVTNTRFTAKVIEKTSFGKFKAVTVEVSGNGYYTGKNVFTAEHGDPLKAGFLVN